MRLLNVMASLTSVDDAQSGFVFRLLNIAQDFILNFINLSQVKNLNGCSKGKYAKRQLNILLSGKG